MATIVKVVLVAWKSEDIAPHSPIQIEAYCEMQKNQTATVLYAFSPRLTPKLHAHKGP